MSAIQKLNLYWRMARPTQLVAIILVYSWGTLIALSTPNEFRPLPYLAGLVSLILASASIHYANEYADYETDALTSRTLFSGGSGGLHFYDVPRETALHAAKVTLIASLLITGSFAIVGLLSIVTLLLLVLGLVGGWMYSLRPLCLAWRGWGELTNAFLGGMLLPVWGFTVQVEHIDWLVFLLSLPFMLYVFTNLLATTWADRHADRAVGKFTLATRWPVSRLRMIYFLVAFVALLIFFIIQVRLVPGDIVWLSILLLPLTLWAGHTYTKWHSPFPSVLVMVVYLVFQIGGRLSMLINTQLVGPFGYSFM